MEDAQKEVIKEDLIEEIHNLINYYKDDEEIDYVDIRVRWYDNCYEILTGDSQYDQDHRGFWTYGSVDVKENWDDDFIISYVDEMVEDLESNIVIGSLYTKE